jgi:hypothetical protein
MKKKPIKKPKRKVGTAVAAPLAAAVRAPRGPKMGAVKDVRTDPEGIIKERTRWAKAPKRLLLSELFVGDEYEDVRQQIVQTGKYRSQQNGAELHMQTRPTGKGDHEIVAIAAVSRDPGPDAGLHRRHPGLHRRRPAGSARTAIQQYWEIYKTEGLINERGQQVRVDALGGRRFKVRFAKKGKQQKSTEQRSRSSTFRAQGERPAPRQGVATADPRGQGVSEHGDPRGARRRATGWGAGLAEPPGHHARRRSRCR